MDYLPDWLADWPLPIGVAALMIAVLAWRGDRKRMRRSDPDAVGFMPWRDIAFWASLAAIVALGFAARQWFAG